jgi:adhesin transport system outer membrane protein
VRADGASTTLLNFFTFFGVLAAAAVFGTSVSASEQPLVGSQSAQALRDKGAMSLPDALALALHTHPLIASREGEYQAAQGELQATRWSRFPTLAVNAQAVANSAKQRSASVSQPLWTGGRLSGQVDSATAFRDMARADIDDARQIVLTDTANAFVDLERSERKAAIAAANVREHQRLYDIIQRRVEASTSPDVDAMLALARLSYSKSQQLQFANARSIALAQLEQLVGLPVPAIVPPRPLALGYETFTQLQVAVLAYSPQLKRLTSQQSGLEANLKVAKSALYPQVSLGYERRFGELLFAQEREQIYVAIDFQPGAGLSSRATISAAGARKRAAAHSLVAARRDLLRQVQTTWGERDLALLQVSPSERLVAATSEVVDSYLRQYRVGRKSWLDVLNAQREVVQAEYTLVDYQSLLLGASYRLAILAGDLTSEMLVDPRG